MQVQEVRTKPLDEDRVLGQVAEVSRLLQAWGHIRIMVTYGFGFNLPIDQLWNPIELDTIKLESFVQHIIRRDIFRVGHADLYIEDREKSVEFLLCHESDIHFASTDQNLIEQVIALWQDSGFALYVSADPKDSAFQKEWKLMDSTHDK